MARKKKSGGSNTLLLLFLLGLLCGYGAWNYQRNVEAEAAMPRPYKGYSDAQLDQLLAAYEGQVEQLDRRYQAAAKSRAGVRDANLLGDAVDEFQRVQRSSRVVRELGSQVSQEQASLKAVREEKAVRARVGSGVTAFLRRAFLPPL